MKNITYKFLVKDVSAITTIQKKLINLGFKQTQPATYTDLSKTKIFLQNNEQGTFCEIEGEEMSIQDLIIALGFNLDSAL